MTTMIGTSKIPAASHRRRIEWRILNSSLHSYDMFRRFLRLLKFSRADQDCSSAHPPPHTDFRQANQSTHIERGIQLSKTAAPQAGEVLVQALAVLESMRVEGNYRPLHLNLVLGTTLAICIMTMFCWTVRKGEQSRSGSPAYGAKILKPLEKWNELRLGLSKDPSSFVTWCVPFGLSTKAVQLR